MKSVLGISAFYHDSATCILVDEKIVAAAQEERFTRKKHDSSYPHNAIEFDCETANNMYGWGSIPSGMEGGKVAASVIFLDLGITDAITDKSRTYPPSFVIPVSSTGKGLFD